MSKRDKAYLIHITESIDLVAVHLELCPLERFETHPTVREACLHTLQTMAESCTKLSAEAQALAPEIDWVKIRGFRNVLVHEYLGDINYDDVRTVMRDFLPPLKKAAQHILKERGFI
jgi:uncharacterized protein with HEPN domain